MVTIDDLIKIVATYNFEGIEMIKKAYYLAEELHKGQYRQSGEPYIIHPLSVAIIIAELYGDTDTICAALLHDTIEDVEDFTKEDIVSDFNMDVANLVDGVTKLKKMNFSSKQLCNDANTRKIITSMRTDVRTIILKLADRLHNMRTLEFKKPFKQKENALETSEIFVPLANFIGAYRIKCELSDLSLKYLDPDMYKAIEERKIIIEEEYKPVIEEMLYKIKAILQNKNIDNEIKIRTKNIYGIYKDIFKKYDVKDIKDLTFNDIHDLFVFKVMVREIDDCYRMLYLVHNEYRPNHEKFKDYICNPKPNFYRSLHTTVFGPGERLVQTQIRTFDMDKVASFGLPAYWDIYKGDVRKKMQNELKNKIQGYNSLKEIDSMFEDNQEFVNQAKFELFSEKVYVYTPSGEIIELPKGSTVIDFAYRIHTQVGNKIEKVMVNEEEVSLDYILQNNDRVKVITSEMSKGPQEWWLPLAITSYARRRIKDNCRR